MRSSVCVDILMTMFFSFVAFEQRMPTHKSNLPDCTQEQESATTPSNDCLQNDEDLGTEQENGICDNGVGNSNGIPSSDCQASTSTAAPLEVPRRGHPLLQIDRQQIQSVSCSAHAAELKDLGVDVYDQDVLEQGVIQQVDNAINEATKAAKIANASKEYESVQEDLR